MDIPFGAIVLTEFPFTDLSSAKRRPALVISTDNARRTDLIVAYISSVPRTEPDAVPIGPTRTNGPSVVRFDKIATVEKRIIAGRIGTAEPDWLRRCRNKFFRVFGFGAPVP